MMKIENFLRLPYLLIAASSLFISTHSFSQGYEPPRTSFGAPDLQGTYSIATVTMLERPEAFAGRPTISLEEAANLGISGDTYLNELTSRPDGAGADVGGYNTFWMECY